MFVTMVLGLLLCAVALLLITALMNLWIGVPSVPTPFPIVRAMIDLADLKGDETVIDLGAGDGRLLIEAKRRYPGISVRGWEIIPTVWLMGWLRIIWCRMLQGRHTMPPLRSVRLILGDAQKADLSDADVLFLYLFPSVLDRLMEKFQRELKPGTRIISHTFKLPGRTPVQEKKMKGYMGETSIFLYIW